MALTEVQELRSMIGETELTDEQLAEIIAAKGTLNASAAYLWQARATESVGLVDISESGSTRKMSAIHEQNLAMAKMYKGLADDETPSATGGRRRGRVNYIERP